MDATMCTDFVRIAKREASKCEVVDDGEGKAAHDVDVQLHLNDVTETDIRAFHGAVGSLRKALLYSL